MPHNNSSIIENLLLIKLSHLFQQRNRQLSDYEHPERDDQNTEKPDDMYRPEQQELLAKSLLAAHPLIMEIAVFVG